jgi:hypothetical protein
MKIFKQNKNNTKRSWAVIKEVINKKHNISISNKFEVGNEYVTDSKMIADHFNSFFSNIGKNLASKIPPSNIDPIIYCGHSNCHSIVIDAFTESEVTNIIKLLKNASSGSDGIHAKILKETYHSYLSPLVYVLNLSLSHGIFPDQMKFARITPIFKYGNNCIVSVLSAFSKLLEQMMYNRLIVFLNKFDILFKQ